MVTSFSGGRSRSNNLEKTTDHGQATGKLYHLWLQVQCTLFCNLQSWSWTHAILVIGLYELLGNPTRPPGPCRIANKGRQHNGQKKKDDLQNFTQKTKDRATGTPLKNRGWTMEKYSLKKTKYYISCVKYFVYHKLMMAIGMFNLLSRNNFN